jgi:hypothetical protein
MTLGFITTLRGIEINIIKTLNKHYKKHKKNYTRTDFENYLSEIGLDDNLTLTFGQTSPMNKGYVISFFNEDDDQPYAFLVIGSWEYQSWVTQTWNLTSLKQQTKFLDPKYLSQKRERKLRNNWKNELVLEDDFNVVTVPCGFANRFYLS